MIQLQNNGLLERPITRLSSRQIRSTIEQLKGSSTSSDHVAEEFAVIVIDFENRHTSALDTVVDEIDRLDNLLVATWAHEKYVGWLSRNKIAIVLPNASAMDAWQYKLQISEHCGITAAHIGVFVRYADRILIGHDNPVTVVPSVDELFVKRPPTWKRLFDVFGALTGLFLAAPVLILAMLLIKLTSRGPAFFRQERIGVGGRTFLMYKLRTMVDDAESERDRLNEHNESDGCAFKMKRDPRITFIGKILRKSSLDELPQLINVLRGEMSLVGPRPLPRDDWHPAELWYRGRHDVTPGLTCTWQVIGRGDDSVTFEDWVGMDLDYVETVSFWTDLKLLFRTIPAVITQRGAA